MFHSSFYCLLLNHSFKTKTQTAPLTSFKLLQTTSAPDFPAFLYIFFFRLINFAITSIGLEEQLLADVVKQERPDLAYKLSQLIISIASDQKKGKVTIAWKAVSKCG